MKSVLITGGTGSFGNAMTERLIELGIERICILSRDEQKQDQMRQAFNDLRLRFFIGDVRDQARLEMAMRGVDTVIHAAALKIVPVAEYNPFEVVHTNVIGAENVVRAAINQNVKQCIALSTDKAVNPVNLYGATKLCAEKVFLAANNLSAGPLFSVCRYGNVIGSRGSVLPLFQFQKANGWDLTITDESMTRFWLKMDDAVDCVLYSLEQKKPKIFVPIVPSIRIVDLAEAIDPGGEREIIGIRPGEKLHESLISENEPGGPYTSDTNTQWLSVEQLREML